MKSLPRVLLERLVARKPRHALLLSCAKLNVCALQIRLAAASPLYRPTVAEFIEVPADRAIAPSVLDRGNWQPELLDFLRTHPPGDRSVLIDVGAHVGLITRQVVHQLPNISAAVCFEPHPLNFRLLGRNLAHLPQCHVVQAAVGAEERELVFYEDLENAGNYSLNPDAMRDRPYRKSAIRCILASEENLLRPLPQELHDRPIVWKSDAQGFDELIVTTLPDSFWSRVSAGLMEIWRIDRPIFDRNRLGAILSQFPIRRFGGEPDRNVSVEEILRYSEGDDYEQHDLFFARA